MGAARAGHPGAGAPEAPLPGFGPGAGTPRVAALVRRATSVLLGVALVAALVAGASAMGGCGPAVGRSAVSFQLKRGTAPPDAQVYIDEQLVGPLSYVAAHGVRLPVGEHRVTVTRTGYFPWDRLVTADRQPIRLVVEMEPIPD